jgi:hypothetical protein
MGFVDYVKHWLEMMKAKDLIDLDALEEVKVEPLGWEDVGVLAIPNACYNNAFHFVSNYPEAKYVVGYGHSLIPIDHAWVKLDGKYHDLSWEINSPDGVEGRAYVPLFELDMAELLEIIPENGMCPPSVVDVLNYKVRKEMENG